MKKQKNAIILSSGGIDSVTTAHYVKNKLNYSKIIVLFFNYGQKSLNMERKCSKHLAEKLKAEFKEISLPELRSLSTSLINTKGKANKLSSKDLKDTRKESENWYVPFRNTIFISYALALADSLYIKQKHTYDLFLGFKCEGNDSYPDTTSEYLKQINKLSRIASKEQFKIFAPLINKDKEDIILLGNKLGVDFKHTFSCYIGNNKHCGYCLACNLRKQGFYWANLKDPTEYN